MQFLVCSHHIPLARRFCRLMRGFEMLHQDEVRRVSRVIPLGARASKRRQARKRS